jgi:hypothetical protein
VAYKQTERSRGSVEAVDMTNKLGCIHLKLDEQVAGRISKLGLQPMSNRTDL